MKKPKPVSVQGQGSIKISVIGYKNKKTRPYLYVETDDGKNYGYIKDYDLKRLHLWINDCLKSKKTKDKTNGKR